MKVHPDNPMRQVELPVSRMIVKVRAGYINYIAKLSGILGRSVDDEDDDLDEFA
ncbi:MAG: zinc-binding protein [Firmicutes bacterium]|nr:zinc-binding protein [Bacillota bacterium]